MFFNCNYYFGNIFILYNLVTNIKSLIRKFMTPIIKQVTNVLNFCNVIEEYLLNKYILFSIFKCLMTRLVDKIIHLCSLQHLISMHRSSASLYHKKAEGR